MPWFADLTPYNYHGDIPPHLRVLHVGWLDSVHAFPTGVVRDDLIPRLIELARRPVRRMRGWQYCEICPHSRAEATVDFDGTPLRLGDAEIWMSVAGGPTYAAPTLIVHYITEHRYAPPMEFIEAAIHGVEVAPEIAMWLGDPSG